MKKLLLFSMILATVAITSCKKEATPEPTLVGNWKIVDVTVTASFGSGKVVGVATDFLNFKTDGTYQLKLDTQATNGTYKINGSKVTMSTSGVDQVFDIQKLTTTDATLFYTEGTGNSKIEAIYNLKK